MATLDIALACITQALHAKLTNDIYDQCDMSAWQVAHANTGLALGLSPRIHLKQVHQDWKMNPSLIAASLKFSHDHNQKGGSLPQPLGTSQETNHLVHSGKTTWDFKNQVEDQATCTAPTH